MNSACCASSLRCEPGTTATAFARSGSPDEVPRGILAFEPSILWGVEGCTHHSIFGSPGIPLGGVVIPLAFPDPLFNLSLNNANSPPFEENQGLLTVPSGHARSRFGFGAGLPSSLTGADLSFAYVTLDLQTLAVTSASNPVTIEILP